MPKTIETTVYTYDELEPKAQEKARDWYLDGDDFIYQTARQYQLEDARDIGVRITSFDDSQADFIGTALETIDLIKANHGTECDTYKTAIKYEDTLRTLGEEAAKEDAPQARIDLLEQYESSFLQSLIHDYSRSLAQDIEFQESDDQVAESIRANEYTFTADGKRFG